MATSSEVLKLDDCPFCGSDDVADDRSVMFCATCEAVGPRISFGRPRSRQELWNRRTASRPSPTEEMVERVARAIYDVSPQLGYRDRPGGPPANYVVAWEHAAEPLRNEAREQARAALKSMEQGDGWPKENRALRELMRSTPPWGDGPPQGPNPECDSDGTRNPPSGAR